MQTIDFSHVQFESERLVTRPLAERDTERLFEMYSDAEAMKFRGSKPMTTLEDAQRMVKDQSVLTEEVEKYRKAICTQSDKRLIGTLLLVFESNSPHSCEIGFSFAKDHWGFGYAQETLAMVERWVSGYPGLHELYAWSIRENAASIRIFRKAGFLEVPQTDHPNSCLFAKRFGPEV